MMDILQALNASQQAAVEHTEGPVIITAGPGTGKTRTLVHRIGYLMAEKGIPSQQILALTFTKKAANELKDRLSAMMDGLAEFPFVGTFHSLGYSILSASAGASDFVPLQLATEEERDRILKEIKQTISRQTDYRNLSTRDLSLLISKVKNTGEPSTNQNSGLQYILEAYEHSMRASNSIDYDDLLARAYRLLLDDDALREYYRSQYRYILIDEFQDTSPLQYKLMKLILGDENNIFVIGDPLQAIYSFRGASDASFAEFRLDFPQRKEITLERNYRSAGEIIEVSQSLFPGCPKLIACSSHQGEVCQVKTFNEYSEADWIISRISQKMGGLDLSQTIGHSAEEGAQAKFADFAVIYRTHAVARALKKRLRTSAIPFQSVGGDSIYERKENAFVIDALRYIHEIQQGHTPCAEEKERFIYLDTTASDNTLSLTSLVDHIATVSKLTEKLQVKAEAMADFQDLRNVLMVFEHDENALGRFLSYVDKIRQQDFYDYDAEKITLLTMHAAKGLEFRYVFVIGCEDGLIPFQKKGEEMNTAEEKRLFYVALTRAKESAYILAARHRGSERDKSASRFLSGIPSPPLKEETDPMIARIEKKIEKKRQDEQQMRLF